jgi:hypothetical protein
MIDEPGSQQGQELMSVNVCRSGREAEAQAGSKGRWWGTPAMGKMRHACSSFGPFLAVQCPLFRLQPIESFEERGAPVGK